MNEKNILEQPEAPLAVGSSELVRRLRVHIYEGGPTDLETKHGYTKHGHGRHYLQVETLPGKLEWVDKAWDRRCDASRWAKRAGAKSVQHWYLC